MSDSRIRQGNALCTVRYSPRSFQFTASFNVLSYLLFYCIFFRITSLCLSSWAFQCKSSVFRRVESICCVCERQASYSVKLSQVTGNVFKRLWTNFLPVTSTEASFELSEASCIKCCIETVLHLIQDHFLDMRTCDSEKRTCAQKMCTHLSYRSEIYKMQMILKWCAGMLGKLGKSEFELMQQTGVELSFKSEFKNVELKWGEII